MHFSCAFGNGVILSGFSYASTYWHLLCFFLLSKGPKRYFVFVLTDIVSLGTIYLALDLVATSIWTVTKFSYSSFGVSLLDVSRRASNLFISVSE